MKRPALAALLLLTACGSDSEAAPAPTVTVTETSAAAPAVPPATTAPPVTTAPPATTRAPATKKPKATRTSAGFTMPNVVGTSLQDAQDAIQATAGEFFYSTSHDASGQGRTQVLDAGWQVCDQSPKPGARFTEGSKVDFGVVRVSEDCP